MKRSLIILIICLFASVAFAQKATLNPTIPMATPTASKIVITSINIMPADQRMTVTYRYLDASDNPIYLANQNKYDYQWTCQNVPAQNPADCTGVGSPYACCTGVGTGSGCAAAITTFSDIFGFVIRAQDVGNTLGKGMRALIINKMKQDIPKLTDVTITFAD